MTVTTGPATIAFTFDTYHSAYENAALTFMTDLGFVGTMMVIPENIDATPGDQVLSSDELAILLAKGWEIGAYTNAICRRSILQIENRASRVLLQ